MKLLLDGCVWGRAAVQLRDAGHNVVWVGDWTQDPGDDAILGFADAEQRAFVTIDKDFGELAVHRGLPHHGILRIVNFPARRHGDVCLAVLAAHAAELEAGALITASPGRVRIRQA